MRAVFASAFKETVAVAVLGCLIGGACGAVTAPGPSKSDKTLLVSVDRVNKRDRLPYASTLKPNLDKSLSIATSAPPPFGCDSALSSIVSPTYAHIYRRCMV
jgi:hypothetical protein